MPRSPMPTSPGQPAQPPSDEPQAVALFDGITPLLDTVHDADGLKRLTQRLLSVFRSRYGFIGVLDAQGALDCSVSVRSTHPSEPYISHKERFSRESWTGTWGKVLSSRSAIIDNGSGQKSRALLGQQTVRSMGAPLICGKRLVGSIQLSGKQEPYAAEELDALRRLARVLSPILLARSQAESVKKQQLAAQANLDRRNLEIEEFNITLRKELARRRQVESELAEALHLAERQNQRMLALARGFVELKNRNSISEMLAAVAERTREVLQAHQASISFQFGADNVALHSVSLSNDHPLSRTLEQVTEDAQRNFENLRTKRWQVHDEGAFSESGRFSVQPREFLAVPLFPNNGDQFGLIQAWDRYEGSFDEQDQAVLRQLAEITAADLRLRLANEELSKTQDQLLKANSELRQFVNIASHDLKAPIRGALNLATWIQEDLQQNNLDEVASQCQLMQVKLTQMRSLIEDLLTYSRAGRFEGNTTLVDTGQLIADCTSLLSPPQGFTIKCISEMPVFETEIAPLRQVLLNLLGNAIKHHERQDGRIEVGCVRKEAFFEFSVRDDGPGIPESFRQRAFEMFRTLKTGRDGKSSGLGLALIKKIIERCSGRIEIRSAEPGCTEFCFQWPVVWVGKG